MGLEEEKMNSAVVNVPSGYRNTTFGIVPENWDFTELGNKKYFKIIMGQSPPSSAYNGNEDGLPFLQGNADFGYIYPNPSLYCSAPMKVAEKNDILISVRAPVGEVNLSPTKICIGRGLSAIRAKNETDYLFLFYYLTLKSGDLSKISAGSTFKAINKKDVESYLVPQPPLPEQRKIAAILSSVDAAIEQTDAIIDVLKTIRVGITKDLLSKGLDECGHLRDPAAYPEQFMDSDPDVMPTGWKTSKVGDLGLWRGGSTPSKSSSFNWAGDILWISPKDVIGNELIDSEDKITREALLNYKMKLFNVGDILVVFRSGILRHTFPIATTKLPFTVNQDIKVLSPKIDVHNRFAFFVLRALGPVVLRSAVKSGTTVESIDFKTFRNLAVLLPPEDEQKKIAKILDSYDARIENEIIYLNKLKQLKHGLMQDLLTGRVRVNVEGGHA